MFNILLQSHSGSWAILVILFLITYFTRQKITLMLQRLFYLIMIVTGVGMLVQLHFPLHYVLKGILAIVLIGVMEMMVARKRKGNPMAAMWIVLIILLALVLLLAYNVIG
ncbi:DUF1516 family protein [Fictibacillus enclensis]|uniref:DUF1516 family protein n=1 Tax=Fictibacillus enclensis TaxID=1017270 RepID=UPI0024BF2B38|nr:DUF1516 family protein [Fictibacillus enclensis]MDM5197230.1 DUF1516 family protein [Fictibacillus enclensis]MDM5336341.1 DUF1516 family protein [Fictibacillus enclensis]WHY72839.1 DUF1516 family protein [Fictibacillus enclensis]